MTTSKKGMFTISEKLEQNFALLVGVYNLWTKNNLFSLKSNERQFEFEL